MAENNDFAVGYAMGQDSGGGNGNGGSGGGFWGGDGIWAILLFAMIFGWGRGGMGGGFGGGGFGGFGGGGDCRYPCATQADVRAAVDQQTLISKLDQQTYGLADSTYALNNTITNGFHGVDNAICTLGYQTQSGFNSIGAQLASCCCDIERGIERNTTQGIMNTNAIQQQISSCCCDLEKTNLQNRFDAQTTACNTLQAIDKLGDRIIGYMSDRDTQNLRDELQSYRLQASQAKQNQYLIDQLRPCPVPAYITCNPYAASYGFGNYGNSGCGCGCG